MRQSHCTQYNLTSFNSKMDQEIVIHGDYVERNIFASMGELYNTFLRVFEDNVVQIDADTKETLTASQLLKQAIKLSNWFKKQGVVVGDRLSIYSENRLEYCVFVVASFFAGATVSPINPDYILDELKHVVNLSKPKMVFCTPKTIDKILNIWPQNQFLQNVVLFGNKRCKNRNVFMFNDLIKGYLNVDVEDFEPVLVNPNETATIFTSSGTTGLPKGVMVTHANLTFYIEAIRQVMTNFATEDTTLGTGVGITPFFHSYGFLTMVYNLLRGLKLVVISKFNLRQFLEIIQNYKITFLTVPPPIILLLAKHPLSQKYDLSSIKEMRCGAAPLGKDLEHEVDGKFNVSLSQGYGMTETTLGVLVNKPNAKKLGSVGTIIPGMSVKVINEQGKSLGPHEKGELCFKGPLIMKGYVGDPGSTAAAIDKDGWLHSGDVAYYDNDKYFFIVDRIKELIKYRAFQVAPAELEALLLTHPDIEDAAVVGLPDEMSGELPLAYVVKKANSSLTEKDVQDFVASRVSPQKKLRGGVIFTQIIPKNPSGKILRRVLKEQVNKLKSKL